MQFRQRGQRGPVKIRTKLSAKISASSLKDRAVGRRTSSTANTSTIFLSFCIILPVRITTEYQIQDFDVFSIRLETRCPVGISNLLLLFLWFGPLPSQRGLKSSVLLGQVEELPTGKSLARSGDGIPPLDSFWSGFPRRVGLRDPDWVGWGSNPQPTLLEIQ
jgi:hypothetical protein